MHVNAITISVTTIVQVFGMNSSISTRITIKNITDIIAHNHHKHHNATSLHSHIQQTKKEAIKGFEKVMMTEEDYSRFLREIASQDNLLIEVS